MRPAARTFVLLLLTVLGACNGRGSDEDRARLSLAKTLAGSDTAGYERALEPRAFSFPEDHGPHPTFRTEWWYVTGNVTSADGRDFGFQLTFFRNALAPHPPDTDSEWSTNQAYMAHFTITDVDRGTFHAYERFDRGAAGLAGARGTPLKVWLGDWSLQAAVPETFPLRLDAEADGAAIHLRLDRGKPPVPQGDDGLSRKGPTPGNASYYYSYTRLPASGTLASGPDTASVSGEAWLDREWSTSALPEGVVGWDWLALQLDDGRDLTLYRLRHADGSADSLSAGTLVEPGGEHTTLGWGTGVDMSSTGSWTSPVDGAVYPAGWRVTLPGRAWDLTVEPRLADQELDLSFRYWEGAVAVRGTGAAGARVEGRGYVELTGYAGEAPGR